MLARDVMAKEVVTVAQDATVEDLLAKIRDTRLTAFPVVHGGGDGRVVGFVSQTDILRALALAVGPGYMPMSFGGDQRRRVAAALLELGPDMERVIAPAQLLARRVHEIMTPRVVACEPEAEVAAICALMIRESVHRVVVVREEHPVGIVSMTDLVRTLGDRLSG
jgi:CBS domain-containing protein